MDTKDLPQRPEAEFEDQSREAAKIAISAIPVVGGAGAALVEAVFKSPLEQRKNRWLDSLADAIRELQDKVEELDFERLRDDETFVTVATQASQIALRNHQQEKLDALRNAVLNSRLPNSPGEDTQLIFLELIDRLTPSHMRILALLDDPQSHTEEREISYESLSNGSVRKLIEDVFPELAGQRDFYNQLVRDLNTAGLSGVGDVGVNIFGPSMRDRRTTEWGQLFIQFISEPPELRKD